MLFQLADLSSVWVTAEVPKTQAAWLKPGDRAEVEVRRFRANASRAGDYLYPELTQATRTLKVRVVVKNRASTCGLACLRQHISEHDSRPCAHRSE